MIDILVILLCRMVQKTLWQASHFLIFFFFETSGIRIFVLILYVFNFLEKTELIQYPPSSWRDIVVMPWFCEGWWLHSTAWLPGSLPPALSGALQVSLGTWAWQLRPIPLPLPGLCQTIFSFNKRKVGVLREGGIVFRENCYPRWYALDLSSGFLSWLYNPQFLWIQQNFGSYTYWCNSLAFSMQCVPLLKKFTAMSPQ